MKGINQYVAFTLTENGEWYTVFLHQMQTLQYFMSSSVGAKYSLNILFTSIYHYCKYKTCSQAIGKGSVVQLKEHFTRFMRWWVNFPVWGTRGSFLAISLGWVLKYIMFGHSLTKWRLHFMWNIFTVYIQLLMIENKF